MLEVGFGLDWMDGFFELKRGVEIFCMSFRVYGIRIWVGG